MTNARQIKQVFRPLIERYGDLVSVGTNALLIKPVRHVALQVFLKQTSHADYTSPRWIINETFILNKKINFFWLQYDGIIFRNEIDVEAMDRSWRWSNPTMIPELIARIETDLLPFLRCIDTLEDATAFYRRIFDRFPIEPVENRMIVDIALGDLEIARKRCLELVPQYRRNRYPKWPQWRDLRTRVMTVAEPLLANDRPALAAILHGWEADNIRGSRYEAYWEPSPFPLEMN